MRPSSTLIPLSVVAALCACVETPPAADGPVVNHATPPDPAPAEGEGVRLVMPPSVVPAGKEVMTCWTPDWVPDEDVLLEGFDSFQGGGGHHLIAFMSAIPRQPGEVFDCTSLETMTTIRPLAVPSGGDGAGLSVLPEGAVVRIPADTIVVMQSHYVNATEDDVEVKDVADMHFTQEIGDRVEAGYFTLSHNGIDLGDGESTISTECTLGERRQLASLLGHMHEWGKSIVVERVRDGVVDELYRVDEWTAEYRDLPPVTMYGLEQPEVLEPGDVFRVTCTFDNDTGAPLRFPGEMCVAFGAYFPADEAGFILCGDD